MSTEGAASPGRRPDGTLARRRSSTPDPRDAVLVLTGFSIQCVQDGRPAPIQGMASSALIVSVPMYGVSTFGTAMEPSGL